MSTTHTTPRRGGVRFWPRIRVLPWLPSVGALAIYLAVSIAYFGWPILRDPKGSTLGLGADPKAYVWCLAWWPHAILHGMNPFLAKVILWPVGLNLAWTTCVPAAALLVAPITLFFGPVVAFNCLSLLAPALAAWAAFLLCRHLSRSYLPALAGGYSFGFSSYELAHLSGHLELVLVFMMPLIVLVLLLFYEGRLGGTMFVILTALSLVIQFGFSTEIFGTFTVWGAIAFIIALAVSNPDERKRMARLAGYLGLSYALATVILAPYYYYIFEGLSALPEFIYHPATYSADLLNYILPTPISLLGGKTLAPLSKLFAGRNYAEKGAYFGLPMLVILCLYAVEYWSSRRAKVLILSATIIAVGSFGPVLHIAGLKTIPGPWLVAMHIPLLKHALPTRFTLYVALIIAIVVALWLNERRGISWQKWSMAALAVIFLLPNVRSPGWYSKLVIPSFFQSGDFVRVIGKNNNVVIVPSAYEADGMLWQAITGMRFHMTGGYFKVTPRSFPIAEMLNSGRVVPDYQTYLFAFLAAHDVRAVIVAGPDQRRWRWLLSSLGEPSAEGGGVVVYRVPSAILSSYHEDAIRGQFMFTQFSDLLQAGEGYLASGGKLSELDPLSAERLGVLAQDYGGFPHSNWTQFHGWLGEWGGGQVGVGVVGSSDEIAPILVRYGGIASAIYFPYPKPLSGRPARSAHGQLLMVFPIATLWKTDANFSLTTLKQHLLLKQFSDLFQAAEGYLQGGGRLSELTPRSAERLGVLAEGYGGFPHSNWTQFHGWLGAWGGGQVGVGVVGSSGEIAPILERYGRIVTATYFPYPKPLSGRPARSAHGQLLMVFPMGQWEK